MNLKLSVHIGEIKEELVMNIFSSILYNLFLIK